MYPFNFRPKGGFIDNEKIFVAMPFADEYEYIFQDLIKPAIKEVNKKLDQDKQLKPYRAKDPRHTRTGWLDILENLFSARVVIGVVSGDNPNVYYELGIAHATQQIERQIVIAEEGYKIKFDLKDIIHCFFDKVNIQASTDELSASILDTLEYFDIINDRLVSQAEAKLSRYEFLALNDFGKKSHFNIPESTKDRVVDAIAYLCHQGLLRLSAKPNPRTIEFSYYWTDLGNAVLHKLEIINQEVRLKRSKEYWCYFDT